MLHVSGYVTMPQGFNFANAVDISTKPGKKRRLPLPPTPAGRG